MDGGSWVPREPIVKVIRYPRSDTTLTDEVQELRPSMNLDLVNFQARIIHFAYFPSWTLWTIIQLLVLAPICKLFLSALSSRFLGSTTKGVPNSISQQEGPCHINYPD